MKAVDLMSGAMVHRGPDDAGCWVDPEMGVALGHRRLAIVDLSQTGHQPMVSGTGRYVITYNGEVYNFRDLKEELKPLSGEWKGGSDTEVVLSAIETWGIKGALNRFVGMFAFALWDRKDQTLCLARDRMGEKPLYYGWTGQTFVFGSELKSLCKHPRMVRQVDRTALNLYLRHNYIPAPYSIYSGVYKLLPGSILQISPNESSNREMKPEIFWSLKETCLFSAQKRPPRNEKEIIDSFEAGLKTTIGQQMVADVPLGAFLSGGIDSSVVVSLMQAQSSKSVKTFTVGFKESGFDEAQHASRVAGHLGTEHNEFYLFPNDAIEMIDDLPMIYDEPFADVSGIPSILISKMTRTQVTVSLSGDGGDELFAGYDRYYWVLSLWRKLKIFPPGVRRVFRQIISAIPVNLWDTIFDLAPRPSSRFRLNGDRLHKLADMITAGDMSAFYKRFVSFWHHPERVVLGSPEPLSNPCPQYRMLDRGGCLRSMQYWDMTSYLPDDILVKVDRASMSQSLESRAPFLDHRIVQMAMAIPNRVNAASQDRKWLLKGILAKYLPPHLFERPKKGFSVPIAQWLRGPLKTWAGDLLNPGRIEQEGFFDPALVKQKWDEHQADKRDWHYHLWSILVFQTWLRTYG